MLTITHLTFVTPTHFSLQTSDLALNAGQAVAIVGSNGAGKTTFLQLLAGILQPTTGEILLNNHNLQKNPLVAKTDCFFIPATLEAFLNFTGTQYWQLLTHLYPGNTDNLLEKCQTFAKHLHVTADDWEQPLHTCSLGTQKKILFAAAFAFDRPILFCDEPFTGLDAASRHQLVELFITFKQSDHLLVFSTHDPSLLQALADSVLIIADGCVQSPRPLTAVDPTLLKLVAKFGDYDV